MGNQQAKEESSGVHNALSSLWSASSDKDDTCRRWGLVSLHILYNKHIYHKWYTVLFLTQNHGFVWHLAEQKGANHWILHMFGTWTDMLWTSK